MSNHPESVRINGRSYRWPDQPVVVVCIDGSEPDYIEQAVADGVMPWMKQNLESRGSDLRGDCIVPSFTNPNNMSIVTGVAPSVHGICGNFYYDRENDAEVMMNEPSLLRTSTIFKAFQDAGARVAVVTAKDKLRRLLGNELSYGYDGAICFSSAIVSGIWLSSWASTFTLPERSLYSSSASVSCTVAFRFTGSRFELAGRAKLRSELTTDVAPVADFSIVSM